MTRKFCTKLKTKLQVIYKCWHVLVLVHFNFSFYQYKVLTRPFIASEVLDYFSSLHCRVKLHVTSFKQWWNLRIILLELEEHFFLGSTRKIFTLSTGVCWHGSHVVMLLRFQVKVLWCGQRKTWREHAKLRCFGLPLCQALTLVLLFPAEPSPVNHLLCPFCNKCLLVRLPFHISPMRLLVFEPHPSFSLEKLRHIQGFDVLVHVLPVCDLDSIAVACPIHGLVVMIYGQQSPAARNTVNCKNIVFRAVLPCDIHLCRARCKNWKKSWLDQAVTRMRS